MDDLILIYEAADMVDANLCQSALEEAGIAVVQRPSGNLAVAENSPYALPPFNYMLFVAAGDVDRAQAVVQAYRQQPALQPEEPEQQATEYREPTFTRTARHARIWIWAWVIVSIVGILYAAVGLLRDVIASSGR